jgi:hypothetical protein
VDEVGLWIEVLEGYKGSSFIPYSDTRIRR